MTKSTKRPRRALPGALPGDAGQGTDARGARPLHRGRPVDGLATPLVKDARLPNAQVVAECASSLGVSPTGCWASATGRNRPPISRGDDFHDPCQRALIDEQIFDWHREAEGYKIRNVPAAARHPEDPRDARMGIRPPSGPTPRRRSRPARNGSTGCAGRRPTTRSRFRSSRSTASSRERVLRRPARHIRDGQIARFIELHEQLYPSLRVFLFDARRLLSAPLTIFGPLMAVIYVGSTTSPSGTPNGCGPSRCISTGSCAKPMFRRGFSGSPAPTASVGAIGRLRRHHEGARS